MKTLRSTLKKFTIAFICFVAMGINAKASVFTAAVSGNFNSATTWGGVIPSSILTSDIIIIPSGITVILNVSASFSGSSSITVNGTLASSSYSTALRITSGSLSGSGTIGVDSVELGLTSGFSFTGNIATQYLTSIGTNVSSAANIIVGNTMMLTSGTLNLTAGNLTMTSGSMIVMGGGTLTSSGSGTLHLDSVYHVTYLTSSATTGTELSGSGLRNITINSTGAVTMAGDIHLNGNLTLTSGTLMLNGHALTFNSGSNLMASGSGTLSGNSTSDINIMSSGGLTGALMFAGGGNTVRNLTINMGSGSSTVMLGNSLNVTGMLNLQAGKIKLGANNLMINAGSTVTGGSSGSYVVTDGAGTLMMHLVASSSDSFKIGTTANYAPIVVKANSSSATGDVSVNIMGDVLASGMTGTSLATASALVKATWAVSSSATSGINYDLTAMWNASMEVNSFDRTHAFISHYTSGAWDASATSAASSSGSLYMVTRTGITSLSPFMVADNTFTTGVGVPAVAAGNDIILFPNPAGSTLHFETASPINNINIYNVSGRLVASSPNNSNNSISVNGLPAGTYYVHLAGDNFIINKTFIKK